MTTRELLGTRGIKVGRHRWCLDRYERTSWTNPAWWFIGPITEGLGDKRVGVEVCGPRHGLALFHTGEAS